MDPDSEDDGNPDDQDDQPDVKDPHIGFDQRRRDMETEMNEDERRDLRGGWEDFVKTEPGEPGASGSTKRHGEQSTTSTHPIKRSKPSFGSDMIDKERLKSLGMLQTTLSKTSNTVGTRQEGRVPEEEEGQPSPLSESQWDCKLCTYVNIADHGRCGEFIRAG
jgi:hypothetical protein